MREAKITVLLVDDDEDDYIITRDLISRIRHGEYQLSWLGDYDAALAAVRRREHDVCLLDYRLGSRTGLELLRETQGLETRLPIILLTGQGDHAIDLEAMNAGAADYLVKDQLTADVLERSIRYAIERKRTEDSLRLERDLISRIMETSPVGIVMTDGAGKITFANRRAAEILRLGLAGSGRTSRNVLDWRPSTLEGDFILERISPLKKVLEGSGAAVDVCFAVEDPDRPRVVFSTNAAPLLNAQGKIDGLIATIEDISERLALESQLRQSQKMESVGRLAAGVAHDMNNVLTIIEGHAGLLLNTTPPASDAARSLKQITAACERAAGFIRHLLAFSHKQIYRTKILDLNDVLRNLQPLLKRMLGEHIDFEVLYADRLPRVAADAGMAEQILMNLAANSRDAMPGGGKLSVETSVVDLDAAAAQRHAGACPGRFVCLTVTDSGCGMDRSVMQRMFEPFFTTKEVGKGTGLGLSTVYGIVRQLHGWVDVQSEVGVGTTFKVFLPASDDSVAVPADSSPQTEAIRGGTETILLVEDEVALQEMMREVLERYHYEVLAASSGAEALQIWDQCEGEIDLVFTDMVMPGGMGGGELASKLKEREPGLKIIFTSGYNAVMAGQDSASAGGIFLPKPYQADEAARLIRDTLDAPAAGLCAELSSVSPAGMC